MIRFDAQKVLLNARQATTDDLLDRVTAYRDGMEPEAVEILEAELRRRGVGREQIERHAAEVGRPPHGAAAMCSYCRRPAVAAGWAWHRLWSRLPLFPRRVRYCAEHRPAG
jgi:hypothetical protein